MTSLSNKIQKTDIGNKLIVGRCISLSLWFCHYFTDSKNIKIAKNELVHSKIEKLWVGYFGIFLVVHISFYFSLGGP